MGRWKSKPRAVSKVQLRLLRELAEHPTPGGSPLASLPRTYMPINRQSLEALLDYALVERVGPRWALTWRGRAYLDSMDST